MASVEQFATRVRNAVSRGATSVEVEASKLNVSLSAALKREGFLDSVEKLEDKGPGTKCKLWFKVGRDLKPLLTYIEAVNFPGRRQYLPVKSIPRLKAGAGVVVISTSQGVLTGREARSKSVGGELLLKIW